MSTVLCIPDSRAHTVLCIPDSRAQEEGASAILCGGFDDGGRNNHRDPGWFDTAGKQASFGCLTGMRGPLKHAVTKELLAPTSARGSVCLVQRVCPSTGRISLVFPLRKRAWGVLVKQSPN